MVEAEAVKDISTFTNNSGLATGALGGLATGTLGRLSTSSLNETSTGAPEAQAVTVKPKSNKIVLHRQNSEGDLKD